MGARVCKGVAIVAARVDTSAAAVIDSRPMADATPAPRRRLLHVVSAPAPTLSSRLEAIRDGLATLDEDAARHRFEVPDRARVLKSTASLCPECLAHVPALFISLGGRVIAHKRCDKHGLSRAVIENDERYFMLSNRDRWGRRYADLPEHRIPDYSAIPGAACCDPATGCCDDFTDQSATKTCTVLVEVTDACNLACPVCYSDAKGDRMIPFETFRAHVLAMLDKKGGADSVQLTGGEATLHPRFWDMVELLHSDARVKRVYVPTNGITLSKDPALVERFVKYRDKLMVLLQFDGVTRETDRAIRDATLAGVRERALKALDQAGVAMQLTMTLARGVNLTEVGDVVGLGMDTENVRLVALQPATYSGRYDLAPDPMNRLTLSDIATEVLRAARLRMRADDWAPIPCSHPGCGWITLFYRRFGVHENVVKYIDLGRVMDTVAAKTVLDRDELKSTLGTGGPGALAKAAGKVIGRAVRPKDIFSVAIKPFMDRFNYDQDRVSSCCHHTMDTRGNLVSFCEYNALRRQGDGWERFPVMG